MGQGERVLVPVLSYLFHRIDQRLDGRPTRITADELWIMLARARFAAKFEEWLRTCRKKNAAVVLATQSLADIASSPLCAVVLESCPTRLYLPNAQARNPQNATLYRSFGLADAQIEVIAAATPKRDYYYVSPRGRRLFSLALTPAALAFVGAGSPEEIIAARQMHQRHGELWAAEWLRHKGLPEWAEYWERTAMEMGPAASGTHLLEPAVPMDQTFREEVTWAAD
jgi:type IV secretion system protein VirB4